MRFFSESRKYGAATWYKMKLNAQLACAVCIVRWWLAVTFSLHKSPNWPNWLLALPLESYCHCHKKLM